MAKSHKSEHEEPNLWKEAYKALYADNEEKEHMHKVQAKLRKRLNQPDLNLKTEEGHKVLMYFIGKQGVKMEAKKYPERFSKVSQNMSVIKELFGAGAAVGGPYVAIPVAALFMVFAMEEFYVSEKGAMLDLAERVSDYYVLTAKSHERTKIRPEDDEDMRRLRQKLRVVYIGLFKAISFASAQLANFFCDDSGTKKWFKNAMKLYSWNEQVEELDRRYDTCQKCCAEMSWRLTLGPAPTPKSTVSMGPGPRNALHWAVADKLYARIDELLSSKECPINALTPRSWTAVHLAAEHGDTKILRTLRSVPGVDVHIRNIDGRTSLHIAAMNNRVGAVKLILGWDHKLLSLRDSKNRTAFLLAAAKGHVKVLQALKDKGQDINESTIQNGWTALHLAAEMGHVDAVKFLLANGARKDARTTAGASKGCTAKQIAEHKGKMEVAGIL
ncbi:hypothetical protein ACJQWK_09530 [Exserohilum turcicum]